MKPEKDEHFQVELYEAEGGLTIGGINRTAVTITNDDGKYGNYNMKLNSRA